MKSNTELMDLSGRVALVTGGAGYVGSAFCETLAEAGANIVVLDVVEERVAKTVTDITNDYDVSAMGLTVDLALQDEVLAVPNLVADKFGRLDILVNCAGFVGTSELPGWGCGFDEQSVDTWRLVNEVNLTAPFELIQASAGLLRQSGHGSVINIGSIYAVSGPDMSLYDGLNMGNDAAYAATKGGLIQLTRWLSTVLAPDVRVNAICPGGIFRNQDPKFVARYEARTPLGRMGTEEDMKGALLFLASDLSAYVTGQNLMIDGGWTAW